MQENHLAQFIKSIKVTSQLIYFGFVLHKRYLLTSTLLTIFKTLAKQNQLSFVHIQFTNSKVMLAFFLFNQKKALKKIRKMSFISIKKPFSFCRYSILCNFLLLPQLCLFKMEVKK